MSKALLPFFNALAKGKELRMAACKAKPAVWRFSSRGKDWAKLGEVADTLGISCGETLNRFLALSTIWSDGTAVAKFGKHAEGSSLPACSDGSRFWLLGTDSEAALSYLFVPSDWAEDVFAVMRLGIAAVEPYELFSDCYCGRDQAGNRSLLRRSVRRGEFTKTPFKQGKG